MKPASLPGPSRNYMKDIFVHGDIILMSYVFLQALIAVASIANAIRFCFLPSGLIRAITSKVYHAQRHPAAET